MLHPDRRKGSFFFRSSFPLSSFGFFNGFIHTSVFKKPRTYRRVTKAQPLTTSLRLGCFLVMSVSFLFFRCTRKADSSNNGSQMPPQRIIIRLAAVAAGRFLSMPAAFCFFRLSAPAGKPQGEREDGNPHPGENAILYVRKAAPGRGKGGNRLAAGEGVCYTAKKQTLGEERYPHGKQHSRSHL